MMTNASYGAGCFFTVAAITVMLRDFPDLFLPTRIALIIGGLGFGAASVYFTGKTCDAALETQERHIVLRDGETD